jgi:hypothetical protein
MPLLTACVMLLPRPLYAGSKRTLYEAFATPLPQAPTRRTKGGTSSSWEQCGPAPAAVFTWQHTEATNQESLPLHSTLAAYQDAADRTRRR